VSLSVDGTHFARRRTECPSPWRPSDVIYSEVSRGPDERLSAKSYLEAQWRSADPYGTEEEALQPSARSFGWSRAGEPCHWLAGSARSW